MLVGSGDRDQTPSCQCPGRPSRACDTEGCAVAEAPPKGVAPGLEGWLGGCCSPLLLSWPIRPPVRPEQCLCYPFIRSHVCSTTTR